MNMMEGPQYSELQFLYMWKTIGCAVTYFLEGAATATNLRIVNEKIKTFCYCSFNTNTVECPEFFQHVWA